MKKFNYAVSIKVLGSTNMKDFLVEAVSLKLAYITVLNYLESQGITHSPDFSMNTVGRVGSSQVESLVQSGFTIVK
ncbi:hypothetical protein [Aeromonas phage AS-zj]|uniref:Uncharacterized protein n=3 Tax=Ceceduovirus TaxID=2842588 RepID=A0A411B844_9CAUD|nr:hypothetical protein HWB28_gp297 [Aeromonas phage AS-zj]YP_009834830.1 hypothetical protein HWB29_gp128 [Aeromonas phage AS-sw]QAX97783.1 hypothetical protein ASswx1_138 [Aeromonas phage Asswx_1]QAX99160.1 hypothetical protein assk_380 [Aeromonas phage Assk]ASU00255.1 hypothetical protein [Aeromonas phage AS-zj]ATI18178.1 hypothetical protein [Aeromonas phage AS-sw]